MYLQDILIYYISDIFKNKMKKSLENNHVATVQQLHLLSAR